MCVGANAPLNQVSPAGRRLRLSQARPESGEGYRTRDWVRALLPWCGDLTGFPGYPCGPAGPALPFPPCKCPYHYCQSSSSDISYIFFHVMSGPVVILKKAAGCFTGGPAFPGNPSVPAGPAEPWQKRKDQQEQYYFFFKTDWGNFFCCTLTGRSLCMSLDGMGGQKNAKNRNRYVQRTFIQQHDFYLFIYF